jgi:tetratricopeptide (TPR) repeat protein
MKRPRSFVAIATGGIFFLAASFVLAASCGVQAQSDDAPPIADVPAGKTRPAAPSLSPLEWNRSLMARGRVSERLGQNEDALADYTLAIESHVLPTDEQARALFDRGLLLDGMSRLDEALADYSASLLLSPQFAAALNNRGNVYRRLGRTSDARRDYLAALEAGNLQSQYSYFGLGEIAEGEGDKTEARQFYAHALAADPKYDLARDRLAAISSGEQMVRLEPPVANQAEGHAAQPSTPADQDEATAPITLRPPTQTVQKPVPGAASVAPDAATRLLLKPSLQGDRRAVGAQVQLGAWRSEAEANQGWDRALRQAGDALRGFSPRIVTVELPRIGRYYRLRVSAGQDGAKRLCEALAAKGLDCMPVRD